VQSDHGALLEAEGKGPGKNSAAACRKMTRCPKVAWRKRKLLRKIRTQENCEPQKEMSVARREMTRRAEVARRKGNIIRNMWARAKAERGIQKVRTRYEGRKSVKDVGGGRLRYLRKRDLKTLRLESTGNIAKTIARLYCWVAEDQKLYVVGGRPPPKRKKKWWVGRKPVM
jgi:hypothetical protein